MIRRFETRDLDEIMDLWLHANIESHSFIEADYWKKNYDMVRKLIPEAKVFVAEENENSGIYWSDRYLYSRDLCKGNGTIKRDRNRTASHRYEFI